MELEFVAAALKELGHPTRLKIYRELVKAGQTGKPVGDLQKKLEIPGSTLSHHIAALASVDLVKQVRDGRVLNCFAQYENLSGIIVFLMNECCVEQCSGAENTMVKGAQDERRQRKIK